MSNTASFSGPSKGWVSVWIGDLRSELDLDGHLSDDFRANHGMQRTDQGEYAVHKEPRDLRTLLGEFFLSDRWLGPMLKLAEAQGISTASCAYVEQHYRHEPRMSVNDPLRFLGCVEMQKG